MRDIPSSTISKLLEDITEEEKSSIMEAYHLRQNTDDCSPIMLPIPNLLATFSQGLYYLSTPEGIPLVNNNGWSFMCVMYYNNYSQATTLIKNGFEKDKFVGLTDTERHVILRALCRYLSVFDKGQDKDAIVLVCTMLGIYHEYLGNIGKKACAPYHLYLQHSGLVIYHRGWKGLQGYGYGECLSLEGFNS